MSFENLRRLAEIRNRLRSTLVEFGVKPNIFQTEEGQSVIRFESEDAKTFCPVAILLYEGSSGWEGCSLTRKRIAPIKVGTDGWTFYRDQGKAPKVTLKRDTDLAMKQIDHALRASGTVLRYDGENRVVSNERLVRFYEELKEMFIDDDFSAECSRNGDIETLAFQEPYATTHWRITFDQSGMNFYRDGTIVGIFCRGNEAAAMKFFVDKFYMLDVLAEKLKQPRPD